MPTASQPLTIAYISNTRHAWCTETHITASLRQLGHTVVNLQEDELDWATIPDRCSAIGAHMLLWTRTWHVTMEVVMPVLARLREMGVPSVSLHLDLFIGTEREHQVVDQPFFHTDLLVTPHDSDRWADYGIRHFWSAPGVFDAECGVVPPNPRRWPHEVVFVGSHDPYPHPGWEPMRAAVLQAFRREFGPRRFGVWPRRGHPVRGAALQELYATAKVVVGDSCLVGDPKGYWSDRVPETLGRGGFLLHPFVPGYIGHAPVHEFGYVDGQHLVGYPAGDGQAAVELAKVALRDPAGRAEIAAAGRELVLSRDTYVHRMRRLLEHVSATLGFPDRQPAAISPTVPPPALPAPQAPTTATRPLRAVRGRWRATFDVRTGEPEDARVVAECWDSNDYQVPSAGFRGTVLDIGANIGAFTVLAARAGAPRVIAVEPEPGNRARLEHHVRVNRLEAVVTVVPLAVVADDTVTPTVGMVGGGGGAHLDPAGDGLVGTTTLAKLLAEHGPIELCKIDIEGACYAAFSTVTADLLAEHVQRITLEAHGPQMPHLGHLDADGQHLVRWGALMALLADYGRLEIVGHPMRGGLIQCRRY